MSAHVKALLTYAINISFFYFIVTFTIVVYQKKSYLFRMNPKYIPT